MSRIFKVVLMFLLIILTELLATKLSAINNQNETEKVIDAINKEMKVIFNDALITAEVVREMVILSDDDSISQEAFNKLSRTLLLTYRNVDALLYLPKGIVALVYPYESQKLAIGHNVLEDQNRKVGATQSIDCKKNTIIGPVKLVQNGKQAFILRKGISNEAGFIGFSSSVIYLESILASLEEILSANNIKNYSVVGYDPDSSNYYDKVISSKGQNDGNAYTGIVNIFNTNWQLSITSNDTGITPRLVIFLTLFSVLLVITTSVKYLNKYRHSEKQRSDLQNEAQTDYLTGLLNRRGLESKFEALKAESPAGAIAVLDIDFFKRINDSHGHEVGDQVLAHFSKLCSANISSDYSLARTGGEEFILLMPHVNEEQAIVCCERIRQEVSQTSVVIHELNIDITVSIGIACFSGFDTVRGALGEADRVLYRAKNDGRNRVYVSL
ncbi:diguanylate cyclase [Vibrio rotiferianus]|uniref:sensor domain-containing diguanylate cyclase n=1 Tax=Vibrio rotiferianus TaxID=190895 RepID=UPI000B5A08A5|nr:diguanylate cyclase [Vibrio rotiferianus]ASI93485.1 sensor domain-containing diguanylate cyclase [Vibrio rotiferianus]